jgi:hypothetical protein
MNASKNLKYQSQEIWAASKRLGALGCLLEGQSQEGDGYSELAGLGLILSSISEELADRSIALQDIGDDAKRAKGRVRTK